MVQIHPTEIRGSWDQGYVLDRHTISSTMIGYNEFGYAEFDTVRSELGELVYRLKYKNDRSVLPAIVETATEFVKGWNVQVDALVPIPPSKAQRPLQPVAEIAPELAKCLGVALDTETLTKLKATPQMFQSGATMGVATRILKEHGGRCGSICPCTHANQELNMHSVFIAGSRALSRLNPDIRKRLDNILAQNFSVLVGDANGADKAVQKYLAERRYRNVTVYCMEQCRNNLGEWPVRSHTAEPGVRRDRHYYGIKDIGMAEDATCGFMLWDGLSKGTVTNAVNLLRCHKSLALYVSPKKQIFNVRNFGDLQRVLNAVGITEAGRFLASIGAQQTASQNLPFDTAEHVARH